MSTKTTTNDRYKYLLARTASVPVQHSEAWYQARYLSANSSQYGSMFNLFGRKKTELQHASKMEKTGSNFLMNFGTLLEDTSGFIFSETMDLKYENTGSLSHPKYPRIRGSVDGFGKEGDKIFVLETKTPTKRVPIDRISELTYMYQIIQNLEVTDGDYAYFNDVRLLACPTTDLYDPTSGYDIVGKHPATCTFSRYQLAEGQPPINLIATSIERVDQEEKKTWIGNLCDCFNGKHPTLGYGAFEDIANPDKYRFVPIGVTTKIGEDAREWVEGTYKKIHDLSSSIGCAFFKLDVHLIQRIERDAPFWEKYLLPIALKWIEDLDNAREGKTVVNDPVLEEADLPVPRQFKL
jgi:hypothetical protein